MVETRRRTLLDCMLDGGIKGKYFNLPPGRTYQVRDLFFKDEFIVNATYTDRDQTTPLRLCFHELEATPEEVKRFIRARKKWENRLKP